jgi:drug/metabolite transporter (DMT)-like permease
MDRPFSGNPRLRFLALPLHQQGLLTVLGAAVLWSTGGLFIKWVSLDAPGVTMWRSLFAGATIALVVRPRGALSRPTGRLTWALAFSYAAMLLLFVTATKLTTAANAIFLQFTAPLYLLLFGRFFLDERPTRLDLASVAVAFGGMGLFFVGRLEPRDTAGNLCAIGSGIAFAAFLLLLRHPSCDAETRPRAMILGNVLLVVASMAVNAWHEPAAFAPGAGDLAGLVFLGVVQIGLAYVLFGFGIAHVEALEASLIGMLEPVLNPLWVFLFLGESPGWWAVAGGAVIVAAVGARTFATERRRAAIARAEFGVLSAES